MKSMKRQLFVMFSAFSMISVIVIAIVSCAVSYYYIINMARQTSTQMVSKTASEVNNLLEDMEDVSKIVCRASVIQASMRTEYMTKSDRFNDQFSIDSFLSELNKFNDSLFSIYYFSQNGISSKSKYYAFVEEHMYFNPNIQKAIMQGETIWLRPSRESRFGITTGEELIASVVPIKELGSGDFEGAVVVEIDTRKIYSYLQTHVNKNGFLCIKDENGAPIIWPDDMTEEEVDQTLQQKQNRLFSDLYIEQELEANGWTVICIIPRIELAANVIDTIISVIVMSIIVSIAALVIARRCADSIVLPIDVLNETMREVENGNLQISVPVERQDEIGALAKRFNNMIATICSLMNHKMQNEKKLRLTELKALQEQIKPHFMYNTLDSIIWLIRAHDNDEAVRMTLALTKFLKIGLSKGNDIIFLQEEVKHLENYLLIQKMRYKDKFGYEVVMDDGMNQYMVPKLILQPLAENAIYHGLKQKRSKGNLQVRIYQKQQTVIIEVEDNGIGMSDIKQQELRDVLSHEDGLNTKGYGVLNVHERLRILYGEPYGVTFTSKQDVGSCFRITLPIIVKGIEESHESFTSR